MLGLSTIVAQTTILRLPLFHGVFYDLLIPLVVFLSLNFPKRKGVLVVIILGLIMDLLSGGIFGIYLSVYFWIFLLVKSLSRYFDVGDTIFQSVLIGVCVLGQHLMFCISVADPWNGAQLLAAQTGPVLLQTIFAALTGPGILMLLGRLQTRFQTRSSGTQRETGSL
ncbi:MAG: rod shape-determining protein MreD [Desulfobacterales bacterium]|nr:rod shape-determining protein MreD [Desulfobacterales bacterium]